MSYWHLPQRNNTPLKIIYIGNGCEGYNNTITIPAKSEITSTMAIPERTTFFLTFNDQYQIYHHMVFGHILPMIY